VIDGISKGSKKELEALNNIMYKADRFEMGFESTTGP
jgi:hypothetical protein